MSPLRLGALASGTTSGRRARLHYPGIRPSDVHIPGRTGAVRDVAVDSREFWRDILWAMIPLFAAVGIWAAFLGPIDPISMSDLGLPSVLPAPVWFCLPLLSAGFFFSISRPTTSKFLPYLYLAALVAVLHGTPAVDYGTLRYPWAWKHLGIVDYIQRHGGVDRHAPFFSIYHNWPGLFAATAMIADLIGVKDFADQARWTPLVLNLLYLVMVSMIYRQFTRDERLIYCAIWIFLVGNWVGQDYFSPQGIAFLLYLALLALTLRFLSRRSQWPSPSMRPLRRSWVRLTSWSAHGVPVPVALPSGSPHVVLAATAFLLILAIAATHPLTPIVMVSALAGLVVLGRLRLGLLLFAIVAVVGWNLLIASPYLRELAGLEDFGSLFANVRSNVADTARMSPEQVVVSWIVRFLSLGIVAAAVAGGLRRVACGYRDGPAAVLTLAPIPLLMSTSYGGEILFRTFLFALPFLSFFAAALFFTTERRRSSPIAYTNAALFCAILAIAFIFANNGKDRSYVASREEIAAMRWLFETAPAKSLLIEGVAIYPSKFENYENFTYLSLVDEPQAERDTVIADPAGVLGNWSSNSEYDAAFVVLTRSQENTYLESYHTDPPFGLKIVEQSLRNSPQFTLVYANRDALIFSFNKSVSETPDE